MSLVAQAVFDPNQTVAVVRGLLIATASVVLIFIGVVGLVGHARKGNSGGVFRLLMASLIALIPIIVGVSLGAVAFGSSVLGFFLPGFV